MRVLITGGAGFIGSHLSDAYIKRGDEVYVIDDLSTGTIENIQHLKGHPRFHYTIDTVHNHPLTAELVDQCDVIFHLAAAVGVRLIVESPVRTIETNVRGTEVVLSLANKKKKKVLIASTSEVYGLSSDVPFREDGNLVMGATTKGRWSYACSKAIDEFLALAYWREKKLPTIVFLGGAIGALGGYYLQYWISAISYPLNIGGRPYFSWVSFIPPAFETTILPIGDGLLVAALRA